MFCFTDLRRYVLILALGLWVGGFTFYALIVLPASHDVLGDRFTSGLITRGVTIWLNRLGVVAILFMFCDMLASRRNGCRWVTATLFVAWLVVAGSHIEIFVLHLKLSGLIDGGQIADAASFRSIHTFYERVSTVQWVACLVFLAFSLLAWRRSDSSVESRDASPHST
ncbi:MAG: hypothetical protein GY783_12275 [Gammaproteobacteria bacterium]|nr:hypothetical protein [Gammaproteobacteria bacterium]MDP7268050.1 hypothetical protein [Pirellulales bacterium]HJN66943.1 hypothetical protein [Pirellulales bacterium]